MRDAGRGFWIVAGALAVGGVLLIFQILANRPIKETIAHAQHTLRSAQAAAEATRSRTGTYAEADADGLTALRPALTFREGDVASTGLDDVSVTSSASMWAASVRAGEDACFYLRLEEGGDPGYGVGADCTGRAALGAADPRW